MDVELLIVYHAPDKFRFVSFKDALIASAVPVRFALKVGASITPPEGAVLSIVIPTSKVSILLALSVALT